MDKQTKYQQIIDGINAQVPAHTMWDGFWIDFFKRGTLIICATYDIIYGSLFNFVFKKVIFFNVPYKWGDTNVVGEDSFRLSNPIEFRQHHPDFDPQDKGIFAVDMNIEIIRDVYVDGVKQDEYSRIWELRTFFIVAEHIYLVPYNFTDNRYYRKDQYEDAMLSEAEYPSMANRVGKLKGYKLKG